MLTIRCTLLRRVFEGGSWDDPRTPEWPPSWMRLFSALVSVAEPASDDDALLRRLEAADPPEIMADEVTTTGRRAFVPTNALQNETRHATLIARTNAERVWARSAPKAPDVWYRWRDLQFDDVEDRRLSLLCRRVPYLGRSTSPVVVTPTGDPPDGIWLRPRVSVGAGKRFRFHSSVRSPHPGALDALRDVYEATHVRGQHRDPWQVGVGVDYGLVIDDITEPVVTGPYRTTIVLRLEGRRLDGRHTARVTHALRRAVLSRASQHLPTLHGHHDGDVVQCAFLGLVHVGHEHADGHLLGVAVAVPDLPREELAVLAGALPAPEGQMELTAGPLGRLTVRRVTPVAAQRQARGLDPGRWSGPARRWATATPVVLDRFLKRAHDAAREVATATVNSRLPEPTVLRVSRRPVVEGGPELSTRDTLRRPGDRAVKPYRYAVVEFATQVRGPVVIGSMRHYGLGLCVPLGERGDG